MIELEEFIAVISNLFGGIQEAFSATLSRLQNVKNHPLKAFLDKADGSIVLGKIYGATILVVFGAWFQGEEMNGCCVPLVKILLEQFLSVDHEDLKPATKTHIESAAIILGAPQPRSIKTALDRVET